MSPHFTPGLTLGLPHFTPQAYSQGATSAEGRNQISGDDRNPEKPGLGFPGMMRDVGD